VRLSLVPTPSIRLSKLRVSDNPPFAGNTFFSAQSVQLRVKFLPLLRGRFEVTELILDKPVFNLLKQADGTFNYSDIGGKGASGGARRETRRKPEAARAPDAAALLIPGSMRIREGQLNMVTKGQAPLTLRGIDLSLTDISSEAPFPFKVAFSYPGLKTVSLEGELDYRPDRALLNLKNNRLRIDDLTFPVRGQISHLLTAPRIDLDLSGDNIDAGPVFQILSAFNLAPRDTEVSGPMALNLSVSGPSHALAAQVRGVFKNVKVNGKRAVKGALTGEAFIRLPWGNGPAAKRLQGTAKLVARDGELTNVDLINKIQRVTGMIGLSKNERRQATTFKTMEADVILGGGYAEFTRLYLVNPQLEVRGSGTMTLEQPTLDMALDTALSAQASARAAAARAATFFKDRQGRIVVPLKVTGPVENPAVNLNTEKLANGALPPKVEKNFSSFFKQLFRSR